MSVRRLSRHRVGVGGFTLIEVLLATAVLAFGLTLAIAALRAASVSVGRGEQEATRTEQVRVVQQFLRRQIGATRPLAFEMDEQTFVTKVIKGEPDTLRFVAPMPGYLSRGGAYVQTLSLVDEGDHQRLEFSGQMLVGMEAIEEAEPRPPFVLLEDIAEASFEYRGIDQTGILSVWLPRWEIEDRLPMQVRMKVRFVDPATVWPPFVVVLPLAASQLAPPAQLDGETPEGEESDSEPETEVNPDAREERP